MNKYRMFDKVIKSKWYSFFKAQNTQTREIVTIKKMHKQISWQQILKNKNISLMNNSKVKEIASIKQIVKDQSNFYCIFQRLDQNLETVIRKDLQKEDIFKISRNLIQLIINLNQHHIVPRELRPSALFINQNYHSMKIAHLDVYNNRDLTKLDLVELQDLRYSVPQVVLTSKDIDERSMVFAIGLIISELILGKPLLNGNTKINYIYEMCKLFPQENIQQTPQQSRSKKQGQNIQQTFGGIMSQYDFSNQFIALLRQMLKIDRNQRIKIQELLQAFDLIVANEENFIKDTTIKNVQASLAIKPNVTQATINNQIIQAQITFQFEKKPTLSAQPNLKIYSSLIASEKNVDDDVAQPIIIKKSSKQPNPNSSSMPIPFNKETQKSRATKQQTISTAVRRPQLTNYALNQGTNLGVKLGFQPTLFSENDNDI